MPSYLSPGVYVEEIPSAVQAIAGVGTSTAGFIGFIGSSFVVSRPNPYHNSMLKNKAGDVDTSAIIEVKLPLDPLADEAFAQSLVGATLEDGTVVDLAAAETAVEAARAADEPVKLLNTIYQSPKFKVDPANIGEPKLCTNFAEFRRFFGDFSEDSGQKMLAHAVFGFFHNGGTRCYVGVLKPNSADLDELLEKFGAVDEIALVAAPGQTEATVRDMIVAHCKIATQDRFAIFDSPELVETNKILDLNLLNPSTDPNELPDNSDYAAFYFPWIQVFDPATKIKEPTGNGLIYVPPSGHMAGIYARVDTNRGVHKAPANEPVFGAVDLKYNISKAQQDGLNPQGVNCIRDLNGNIRVWGARTIGGDANGEWRYINVRRVFLFLRESIDEGTQWAVFEPNDDKLWAKITRNVSAFLTTVWRSGALFGTTEAEAFYVKCDAETNPPELREVGQVVTEIGVAVVRPAEFVIFRISQWLPETS